MRSRKSTVSGRTLRWTWERLFLRAVRAAFILVSSVAPRRSRLVLGRRLPHQPAIEPPADVFLILYPARGSAAAGQLVVLARKAHQDRGLSLLLERAKHDLSLPDRSAPVLLAVEDHERRRDARGEVRRGALQVFLGILEGRLS